MSNALHYIRVSSKEQEKEGWSLDAQEKLGIEYAARHNLKIVKTWKVQESAWSNKKARTAFIQMIEYAKKHSEVKNIIFDITDRMTRNDFDKMKIIELIQDFGKTIHFSRSNKTYDKNSGSDDLFMLDIEVAVAKKMSNDISRKSQMGMLEKAEQGFYPSTAPFGYRNNKITRLIEVEPDGAPFIKNAYEQMATGSYSINLLADWLFRHGFKSKSGRKIYKSALVKVLKNPIYYGAFRWKNKLYQGNHEKIITKQLFDEVQSVFDRKTKPYKTRKGFAFSNLLNCGECGCKVLGEEKKNQYIYYHCSFSKGRHNGIGYVPENRLADLFEDCIKGVTLPDDKVDWLKENFRQRYKNTIESNRNRLLRLQSEHDRVNTRLSKLYDLKLDGGIADEMFASKEKEYQTELMTLKSQIDSIEKVNPNFYEDGCKILELCNSLPKLYVKANHQEKGHLLKLLASNYRLTDVNICPTWRKPLSFIAEGLSRSHWLPREGSNLGHSGYDLTYLTTGVGLSLRPV